MPNSECARRKLNRMLFMMGGRNEMLEADRLFFFVLFDDLIRIIPTYFYHCSRRLVARTLLCLVRVLYNIFVVSRLHIF